MPIGDIQWSELTVAVQVQNTKLDLIQAGSTQAHARTDLWQVTTPTWTSAIAEL